VDDPGKPKSTAQKTEKCMIERHTQQLLIHGSAENVIG
jgi:hypothetical protein